MDTQSLRAFLEVANCGSFSQAAENLHLTQPAVSKRIATLESRLDSKLFDRIGRRISLTEAGQALKPQALAILQSMQEVERSIRKLRGTVSGTLSLGISHHIGLHRLPPVLKEFSRRYPQVHLDINFMDSEEAHEQLVDGRLELAVVTLDRSPDPVLHQQIIWHDPLTVVAAADHPLLSQPAVSLKTLSQIPAIIPGLNTYTGQIVESLFRERKLALNVSMATNFLETIKMMVSIGLGWSILPTSMVDTTLRTISVKGIALERKLGYVFHRNRSLSNAATAFIDGLKRDAGDSE